MLAEKHIQHVTCLNEDDCRLIRESLAQIGKNPPGVQPVNNTLLEMVTYKISIEILNAKVLAPLCLSPKYTQYTALYFFSTFYKIIKYLFW